MTTVDDVIAVARQLSPAEQLEIIQSLAQTLRQQYADAGVRPLNPAKRERVLGLHEGKLWMSGDFDDELLNGFWFGSE